MKKGIEMIAGQRWGDWIETYTGKKFYPLDPRPDEVTIEDIAHSLALQCRYAGHSTFHYSVAQHCLIMSHVLRDDPVVSLWALLHDAAEAYLIDVPSPVKIHLTSYRGIEVRIEACIAQKFGLPMPMPGIVKKIDSMMIKYERKHVRGITDNKWFHDELDDMPADTPPIQEESWRLVELAFLSRFNELILEAHP